jgi:4-methyl-5(b-hydroxyethyl)-thiazole monophosphate biosynthesis
MMSHVENKNNWGGEKSNMKIYVLIYNNYAHFEVDLVCWIRGRANEVVTVALEEYEVQSAEGFIMKAHKLIDEVDVNEVDLFIIPGGDSESILGNAKLQSLLRQLNKQGKLIGAICYGPILLADAGILKEKKFTTSVSTELELFQVFNKENFIDEGVVVDGNIVTAKGDYYVDFALQICKMANLTNENALNYWAKFFRSEKEVSSL